MAIRSINDDRDAGMNLGDLGKQPLTAAGKTYTVQPGDTLAAIGRKFGVNYMAIARANNIANPNLIHVGQVLQIP